MKHFKISKKAGADIDGILDYIYAQFGTAQAESYYGSLRKCFQMLAENPAIGRFRTAIHPPLHSHHHRKHINFHDIFEDHILIVRVLHERMDIERHLREE
ncbi:MAG TPA: type II toxin-antitoxin system RelE/ParE family toxin [Geminicoccaceae bacterium]|nr:type II toxin-antitoxin system RelE/ParE family toxin [Geminicoccaceae bacterium]